MLCSGYSFLLDGLVLVCVCQGLRERLVVWRGNFVVTVPTQGVVLLYGGEVVEGVGVLGDLVLILRSLVAEVVSGSAPSHLMHYVVMCRNPHFYVRGDRCWCCLVWFWRDCGCDF